MTPTAPATSAPAATTPPPVADSPHVANLKFKKAELERKLTDLSKLKTDKDHNIEEATQRTKNQLAEIESELKRS